MRKKWIIYCGILSIFRSLRFLDWYFVLHDNSIDINRSKGSNKTVFWRGSKSR